MGVSESEREGVRREGVRRSSSRRVCVVAVRDRYSI